MKKIILIAVTLVAGFMTAHAQKFALVDMEYILKNIPAYEMANEQLNQVSQRWQREVDELKKEADTMYKNYQADMVFLTDDQKKKKEAEITEKEKEAQQLQLWPPGRAVQEAPGAHQAHPGRRVQRLQEGV